MDRKHIIEAVREGNLYELLAQDGHDIAHNDLVRVAQELDYAATYGEGNDEASYKVFCREVAENLCDYWDIMETSRRVATIQADDKEDGEVIVISAVGAERSGFSVKLSNGEAAPFGSEQGFWDIVEDVKQAWGAWSTFEWAPYVRDGKDA